MPTPIRVLSLAILVLAGCVADDLVVLDQEEQGVGSGSTTASPTPTPSPSPTTTPTPAPSPSPTASPSPSPTPSPTPGCEPQPEPECPGAPPDMAPQDPGIASGSRCRGACGANCPSTCREGPDASTCVEWQTADCQWHAKVCTYPVIECGTHEGCRTHDSCYDDCAGAALPFACRLGCDRACVATHGVNNCTSWAQGNGPYDDTWLSFAGTPTSYTYDSTCY